MLSSRFDLQDVVRRPGEIQLVGDVIDHQLLDMHGVVVRAADLYSRPSASNWTPRLPQSWPVPRTRRCAPCWICTVR